MTLCGDGIEAARMDVDENRFADERCRFGGIFGDLKVMIVSGKRFTVL